MKVWDQVVHSLTWLSYLLEKETKKPTIKIYCDSSVWNPVWSELRLLGTQFSVSFFLITWHNKENEIYWVDACLSLLLSLFFNFFCERGKNESPINIAEGMKPVLLLHCTYSYSLLNRKMLTAKLNLDMLIAKTILQYGTSIACYVFENQKYSLLYH